MTEPILDLRYAEMPRLYLGVLFPLLLFLPTLALPQTLEPNSALVTTETLDVFPAGQPISVEAESDSEINSRLVELIRRELKNRGISSNGKAASPTLRFATGTTENIGSSRRRSLELEGRGGSRGRSSVTGVLTIPMAKKSTKAQKPASGPRVQLRFDLISSAGRKLWEGEIVTLRGNSDRFSVLTRLVPILVERLGKSTPEQIIPFDN